MTLPFSLDVALRYLRPKRSFLSVVTVLSVVGVGLGVMILVIVLSVMSGFGEMWREKILGFNAHLTVSSFSVLDDPDAVMAVVETVPGVTAAAPFVQGLGFITVGDQVVTPVVRGVDAERERRVSKVPDHMVSGRFEVEDDRVVMGRWLARSAGVRAGDTVTVYSPQTFARPDQFRLPEDLHVAGLFEVGMYDFDANFMLCSLVMARDLFGMREGVQGIQVMTLDPLRAATTAVAVREALGPGFAVETWMDQNQQLFSALQVEKNMMAFLLLFIALVASFCITITLLTIVVQKTREIGLLKAVGHGPCTIVMVFVWQGWIQGVAGIGVGLVLGLLALHYRNDLLGFLSRRYGFNLFPPELYHLSEIPANTSPSDVGWIALAVMVLCTVAAVIPAWRAAAIEPARALRNE